MVSRKKNNKDFNFPSPKTHEISCNGSLIEISSRSLASSILMTDEVIPTMNLTHANITLSNTTPFQPREDEIEYPGMFDGELSHVILYSFVFMIAVLGNFLVILTLLANKRMRTVTSCFLLSLSLSDLLLALICMPVSLTGRVLKRFVFGTIMCKVMPYFMGVSVSVSTFTMLAISVERYYAICRPLKSIGWQTKSHAYKVIVAVWAISFLMNLPFAVLSQLQYIPLIEKHKCSLACRLMFPNPLARQLWYVFEVVTLFGIPGIAMTVSYTLVSCKIWAEFKVKSNSGSPLSLANGEEIDDEADAGDGLYLPRKKRKHLSRFRASLKLFGKSSSHTAEEIRKFSARTSSGSVSSSTAYANSIRNSSSRADSAPSTAKSSVITNAAPPRCKSFSNEDARIHNATARLVAKKRVVKMLIVILILFFACWTPVFIVNVWKAFDPETAMEQLDGAIEIIQLMSYISTCVNPIVYCFMNKRFREGFLKAFLCCIPKCCVNIIMKIPVVGTTTAAHG